MSMSMSGMDSSSTDMPMMANAFTASHHTSLYGPGWTPSTSGGYAGTCIFLVFFAILLRLLFAFKAVLEARWAIAAKHRRFVLVKGRSTEAGRIDQDPDAKTGSLITVNGVEENVKVVTGNKGAVMPWRLSVDLPRAAITTVIAAVAYLL
jgi:hypothetical protein